jgi:MFS family permease
LVDEDDPADRGRQKGQDGRLSLHHENTRARDLDYLGIAVFVAAVVPLLVGLTNKGEISSSTRQLYSWSDSNVAGPIVAGALLLVAFVLVEMRAREPIIPIDLFRNREYSIAMLAALLFGISSFIGVIFMPRFFQTVRGVSATASGYSIWSLMLGFIGGSIVSGVLISRSGRYKWLITSSSVLLVAGGYLMTHLATDTPDWALWAWMLLLGLGVGPSIAAFTVVVQSLVPNHRLGVASGTLTFIRQLATTAGLAIAGTMFSASSQNQLAHSVAQQSVPSDLVSVVSQLALGLQAVGNRSALLQQVLPPAGRTFIPAILAVANNAFATAIGGMFSLTVITGCAALVCTLLLRDRELTRSGT